MKVKDIMTEYVETVNIDAPLREAASIMKDLDVGFVPVMEGKELAGIITDRDIATRAVAAGKDCLNTRVDNIMSTDVKWISEDAELDQAVEEMEEFQIRRLPVMDSEKRLCGVISLGDISVKADFMSAAEALEMISEPSHTER